MRCQDYRVVTLLSRGAMALMIFAWRFGPPWHDIETAAENTGVGHVFPNKGGLLAKLEAGNCWLNWVWNHILVGFCWKLLFGIVVLVGCEKYFFVLIFGCCCWRSCSACAIMFYPLGMRMKTSWPHREKWTTLPLFDSRQYPNIILSCLYSTKTKAKL